MPEYLGIDTSNYTTSAAIYFSGCNEVLQEKKLLPVKEGQLGLRQSDAVFHHTKQLPEILEKLMDKKYSFKGIGVSVKPRIINGSYMPCFLAGTGLAYSLSSILKVPVYETSHQVSHILAALYSCNKLEFINQPFIAFHVSGGTTDCLYVTPDDNNIINIEEIGTSLDLKAGQAVDRVGLMLGLRFPCGRELDSLARKSAREFKIKTTFKGKDCCLSGVENKCRDMKNSGESPEDIAKLCIMYICETLSVMTLKAIDNNGDIPVVFAGGVMSNSIISKNLSESFGAYFAKSEFSCDNAAGVAIYAALKEKK